LKDIFAQVLVVVLEVEAVEADSPGLLVAEGRGEAEELLEARRVDFIFLLQ
jgi:hypothetical protein